MHMDGGTDYTSVALIFLAYTLFFIFLSTVKWYNILSTAMDVPDQAKLNPKMSRQLKDSHFQLADPFCWE